MIDRERECFVDKAISKQLRRRTAPWVQNQDQSDMKTVRIPFVESLSQEKKEKKVKKLFIYLFIYV